MSADISRYQPISADIGRYLPISADMRRYQPISTDIGRYRPILADIGRYLPISADIGRYRPISADIGRYLPISVDIGRYRPISAEQVYRFYRCANRYTGFTGLGTAIPVLPDGEQVYRFQTDIGISAYLPGPSTTPPHSPLPQADLRAITCYSAVDEHTLNFGQI